MPSLHRAFPLFPLRTLCLAAMLCAGLVPALAADSKASRFYEDALGRYDKQDMPGAIIQLKNALQIDKNMLPVQVLLGKALLANGEVAGAEVALNEALRLGVNRAEIVLPLGQAYLAQGKHKLLLDQPLFAVAGLPPGTQVAMLLLRSSASSDLGDTRGALKALEDARAFDPRSVEPWIAEVPVRIRARQYREAADALSRAQALAPQAAEVRYQRGALAHVQGDPTTALGAYTDTLLINPRHIEALVARAGLYVDLGRPADAAKDLALLQEVFPREPRAAYLRALLANREGKTDVAKTALRQVTQLIDGAAPEMVQYRPQLLLLNGLAHYTLNEKEKAKPYLEALQRVQGTTAASKLLAQIYLGDGNLDGAITVLEAYLRAQPADGQAMTLLASAHMAQGRNARAITLMQEALRTRDGAEFRTVLGMGLLGTGQIGTGTAELESAYRKNPAQTQAGVALVGLYLQANQAAKALPIAESLAKLTPGNPGFQDLLGMSLAQSGKIAPAKAAFERAIALDAEWLTPKLHLARVETTAKEFDAAAARLAALLKADEKNVEVLMELSVLAAQRGQADETLRWLERANTHASRADLRPGLAIVDLHLRNGRAAPALEAARNLNAKGPNDLMVILAYGRAQLAMGNLPVARSSFNTAARSAGENAALQVQIASLQMDAGNPDGAAYGLERALAVDPAYLPAMAMMGDVDIQRQDLARAEQRARQIVAQYPKLAVGHSLLGDVSAARGQTSGAAESYRRAYQLEPSTETSLRLYRQLWPQDGGKSASAMMEQWLKQRPQDHLARQTLADGYAQGGHYTAARANYEQLLKTAPDDAQVLNNLANVLLRLNDPAALTTAERAVAQAPGNASAIDTLGWALFKSGNPAQLDRALQLLRDARLREPGDPDIRFHLATVLHQSGRKAEALAEIEAALEAAVAFEHRGDAEQLFKNLR